MKTISVPCESSAINRIVCGGRDVSDTFSCEENSIINIIHGNYGRTVSYEEECNYDSSTMDTNCVSEESNNIVSIIFIRQRSSNEKNKIHEFLN